MHNTDSSFYSLIQRASFLKHVPLFHSFSSYYLTSLAKITKSISLSKGQVLFHHNDFADSLYIIRSGQISIQINGKELALMKRYECLGELSILEESFRSATAVANEDMQLISISSEDFKSLISTHSEMALIVMRTLAQRLRERETIVHCLDES